MPCREKRRKRSGGRTSQCVERGEEEDGEDRRGRRRHARRGEGGHQLEECELGGDVGRKRGWEDTG